MVLNSQKLASKTQDQQAILSNLLENTTFSDFSKQLYLSRFYEKSAADALKNPLQVNEYLAICELSKELIRAAFNHILYILQPVNEKDRPNAWKIPGIELEKLVKTLESSYPQNPKAFAIQKLKAQIKKLPTNHYPGMTLDAIDIAVAQVNLWLFVDYLEKNHLPLFALSPKGYIEEHLPEVLQVINTDAEVGKPYSPEDRESFRPNHFESTLLKAVKEVLPEI